MEGIILLLDRTQPLHVLTVHLLQRCIIQRIVGVRRRILQVLAVLDPGFHDGSAQASHAVVHIFILVERIVVPRDKDGRWEDGAGTVGRVRGWSPVCEDVGLEWIKLEDDQGVVRAARPVAVKLLVSAFGVLGPPRNQRRVFPHNHSPRLVSLYHLLLHLSLETHRSLPRRMPMPSALIGHLSITPPSHSWFNTSEVSELR
jgi:hypothetical protein